MSLDRMNQLIFRYFDGLASEADIEEMNRILARDPAAGRAFAAASWQNSCLIDAFQPTDGSATVPRPTVRLRASQRRSIRPRRTNQRWPLLAAAASLLLTALLLIVQARNEVVVASLGATVGSDSTIVRGDTRLRAEDGMPLHAGDCIETAEADVWLMYAGEPTRVEVRPGSRILLTTVAGSKRLQLENGSVSAEVAKQPVGAPMRFVTAHAEAIVLGTRLEISVSASGTRLEVTEGLVRFEVPSSGQQHDVAAGSAMIASPQGGLSAAATRSGSTQVVWDAASPGDAASTSSDMEWIPLADPAGFSCYRLQRNPGSREPYGWVTLPHAPQDWRGSSGLLLRIRGVGDGRVWDCEIFDDQPVERFLQPFVDDVAGWHEVYLPFDKFSRRPEQLQDRDAPRDGLGLARMHGVGFITTLGSAQLDVHRIITIRR